MREDERVFAKKNEGETALLLQRSLSEPKGFRYLGASWDFAYSHASVAFS